MRHLCLLAHDERSEPFTGMAPMEYLLSWRMALSKDMLRCEDGE